MIKVSALSFKEDMRVPLQEPGNFIALELVLLRESSGLVEELDGEGREERSSLVADASGVEVCEDEGPDLLEVVERVVEEGGGFVEDSLGFVHFWIVLNYKIGWS